MRLPKIAAAFVSGALLLGESAGATKDDSYYASGFVNPNVEEAMYWKDSGDILQNLSQFSSLYVVFHQCAWTSMKYDNDGGNNGDGGDDGEDDETDYWYMDIVPPMGANVAFSLYGSLEGDTFSGCGKNTFISTFYTNQGFNAFVDAMYLAGVSAFSSSYADGLTADCQGGYGVGCDYKSGFAVHTYSGTQCFPEDATGVSDTLSTLNAAINKYANCVQIYDSDEYSGEVEGTALELLDQSHSCLYQDMFSPESSCPDPYGKLSTYQANFQNMIEETRRTDPHSQVYDYLRPYRGRIFRGVTLTSLGLALVAVAVFVFVRNENILGKVKSRHAMRKANKKLITDGDGITEKGQGGNPPEIDKSFATAISGLTKDSAAFTQAKYAEVSSAFDGMCKAGGEAFVDVATTLAGPPKSPSFVRTNAPGPPKIEFREQVDGAIDQMFTSATEFFVDVADCATANLISDEGVHVSVDSSTKAETAEEEESKVVTAQEHQTQKSPFADGSTKSIVSTSSATENLIIDEGAPVPVDSSSNAKTAKEEESKIVAAQERQMQESSFDDGNSTKSIGRTKSTTKEWKARTNEPVVMPVTTAASPKDKKEITSGSAPSDDNSIQSDGTAKTKDTIKSRAKVVSSAVKDRFKGATARANRGKKLVAPPSSRNTTRTNRAELGLSGTPKTTTPREVKPDKVTKLRHNSKGKEPSTLNTTKTKQAGLGSSGMATAPQEVKQDKVTKLKPNSKSKDPSNQNTIQMNQAELGSSGTTTTTTPREGMPGVVPVTMETAIVDDAAPAIYKPPCASVRAKRQEQHQPKKSSWWY